MNTTLVPIAGRNRLLRVAGLILGLIVVRAPVYAQNDGTESIADARARAAIQLTIQNTRDKGMPIEPLLRKVREGVSKRADPTRIQAAVQSLAQRLEVSFKALAPSFSVEELSAGESALQVGVPSPTLRDFRKLSPTRPVTVPLGILTELVAQAVPVPLATKRVRELVERGATNSVLVAMGETIASDVAAGIAPGAALDLRAKGVMSLLTAPPGTTGTGLIPASPKPPIRPK